MERGAPEAGGMGGGRRRKGGGEGTCAELLTGRMPDRKSKRRDREQKEDREEELRRMEQRNQYGRGGR